MNGPTDAVRQPMRRGHGGGVRALLRPGRPRAQLRTRVLAGVLAVTVIALAGFDLAAVSLLRRYLISQTDSQLKNVLDLYRPQPGKPGFPRAVAIIGPARRPPRGNLRRAQRVTPGRGAVLLPSILNEFRVTFFTTSKPPKVLLRGPGLQPRLPSDVRTIAAGPHVATVPSASGRVPLRLWAIRAESGTLVATTSLAGVDSTVARLEVIVAVGSVAALALAGLGVVLIVRRGLRPIETMANAADKLSAGDLSDRVGAGDPGTEVGRLAAALNGMLDRIRADLAEREAAQQAARRFFADASHELRNPLASLRAHAELYQQGALTGPDRLDQAMGRITAEAQRMSALVDDMLRLARLDQQPGPCPGRVHLTALVAERAARAAATDADRTYNTSLEPGLAVTADGELLARAVDNLLANVAAHTPPGTTATVSATRAGPFVALTVADDGPGVPPGQLPRIFDRFYRARISGISPSARTPEADQPPGTGLGLAIVAATAAACDGTVTATIRHPHGLQITLALPVSSRTASDPPGTGEAAAGTAPGPLAIDAAPQASTTPGTMTPAP
jgi:two-component system, OmpR family, sensor kinase